MHDSPLGVLSHPQQVAEIVQRVSPETLVVLDAVCAVASEDIKMDGWGIDVVVSASQKGLGAPPGLSVVLASQKAMKVKFLPRRAYKRSADGFRRSSRPAQNQLPRTMPAGRGKTLHVTWVLQNSPYRRWLPIMKAYEGGSAAYFATPPVNLIRAYHESLSQITKASPSLDERLERHRETSSRIKAAAAELGISQIPASREIAANGMTAVSNHQDTF